MRIAVLADIHGNVPALEAVVADVRECRVDEVLVGGDLVGRGPQGRAVVERVRELGWRSVRGNHEEYLLAFRRREVPPEWLELDEWAAARWMAQEIGSETERWIGQLPFSMTSVVAPEIEVVHGSPRSTQEGIGPWTDDRRLGEMVNGVRGRLLLCGHTHRPMVRPLPPRTVVNVGSVGLSFDGDRRGCWALCERDTEAESWRVELRRVDWDLDALRLVYESSGFGQAAGVTGELLWLEHEQARPWLVPFLGWCQALGRSPHTNHLTDFSAFYRPGESLRVFHQRVGELAAVRDPVV